MNEFKKMITLQNMVRIQMLCLDLCLLRLGTTQEEESSKDNYKTFQSTSVFTLLGGSGTMLNQNIYPIHTPITSSILSYTCLFFL